MLCRRALCWLLEIGAVRVDGLPPGAVVVVGSATLLCPRSLALATDMAVLYALHERCALDIMILCSADRTAPHQDAASRPIQ